MNKVFIETYGCQMNVYDSELVISILQKEGWQLCDSIESADMILVNTCSIRDNAEQRVWGRLDHFLQQKRKRGELIVGVLGCMAERVKEKLLEHPVVNIVAGPDTYRKLPEMIRDLQSEPKQMDIRLSRHETYADITPVRTDKNGVSAYISIMRGCNNMCT